MHPARAVGGYFLREPKVGAPYARVVEFAALQAAARDDVLPLELLREAGAEFNDRWRDVYLGQLHQDDPGFGSRPEPGIEDQLTEGARL